MYSFKIRHAIPILFLLATALVARAVTADELQARADALVVTYQDLAVRADACPGGQCAEASQIVADWKAAEAARAELAEDRATLGSGCGCSELDATLDSLAVFAKKLPVGGWDDIS